MSRFTKEQREDWYNNHPTITEEGTFWRLIPKCTSLKYSDFDMDGNIPFVILHKYITKEARINKRGKEHYVNKTHKDGILLGVYDIENGNVYVEKIKLEFIVENNPEINQITQFQLTESIDKSLEILRREFNYE